MPAVTPELRDRLFEDTPFWAKYAAKIVNRRAQLVALEGNLPQLRFDEALERQRAEERPMRAIVLKARKLGFSTWVQGKIMHRITQRRYRRALVVGQDNDTAGELFGISDRIFVNLPPGGELGLKPTRSHFRKGRYMEFGEAGRMLRDQGLVGLDSSLQVDTANEVDAGRGYTYTELHCSEVAFWPDVAKLTALLNAVPDEPETLIVLESTANGSNHFKTRWQQAVSGESEYAPVFAAWHEDPAYAVPFTSDEAREAFTESIGEGPWGEDEPRLVREFGCTPEQLNWRRKTIVDKTESKLDLFKQEYPASPEEAFKSSGKHVFSMVLVSRVLDGTRQTDPALTYPDNPGPQIGELRAEKTVTRKLRDNVVQVPREPLWVPRDRTGHGAGHPFWRIWDMPDPGKEPESMEDEPRPPGAYVVAVDPSEGIETESGETAYHAIQVIDHRTREQVAEYRSRIDPDLIAKEALLVALFYNRALIVPETTGGYGGLIARKLWRDFGYPLVYRRRSLEKQREKQEERLGWDTSRTSKHFLIDHGKELLREWYGDEDEQRRRIRSALLANEMTTYVRDEKGKMDPEPDAHADLLMSWLIAQFVAHERPVPRERKATVSTTRPRPRDPVTGY